MKAQSRHLASVVFAIVPLLVAVTINGLLYNRFGIGQHRGLYDVFDSPRALVGETETTPYAPVWAGRATAPLKVVFFGSSPTTFGIDPREGNTFEAQVRAEVSILSFSAMSIDLMVPFLGHLLDIQEVHTLVLEYTPSLNNDSHIAFRGDDFGTRFQWPYAQPDEELQRAVQVIRGHAGYATVPYDSALALTEDAKIRRLVRAQAREYDRKDWRVPAPNYERISTLDKWQRFSGVPDQQKVDRPSVRTNTVAILALGRILSLCRRRNVGLVVWVPPRSAELRMAQLGRAGRFAQEAAYYSRYALYAFAERERVPVLDFDAYLEEPSLFRDAMHASPSGASALSRSLFTELRRVFDAAGAGGYRRFGGAEDPMPYPFSPY